VVLGPATVLILVLAGLVVVAGIVTIVVVAARSARRAAPRPDATAWRPIRPDPSLADRFTGGPTSEPGRVTRAMQCVRPGLSAIAFEYASGPGAVTTVVAVDLPATRPMLDVRRATRQAVGGVDIAMGDGAFDAAFVVHSAHPGFAHDVLQPATRAWLLSDPRSAYYPIRLEGARAYTWGGHPLQPTTWRR
jgi:hypothetical protein